MTDKEQIMINEINETGFYCAVDDTERLYIYEVINNTDEGWLKENPDATLLIDEWIYDYTDNDDRKIYSTSGNLVALCFEKSTCEVIKITDTAYKIYGGFGQYLIEDKPTYKEQLIRKTQECEELKRKVELMMDCSDCKVDEYKKALEEIEEFAYCIKNFNFGFDELGIGQDIIAYADDILDIINRAKDGK